MDIAKLARFNEWWTTERVKESLLKPYRRSLFNQILKFLKDRQIVLVYGLRRVGKTTLLYQLVQQLLEDKTDKKNILYFSFDESAVDLEELMDTYEKEVLKEKIDKAGQIYIFLDEVQKLKGWQNKVKVFYDIYPNVKFFLSGSASIAIERGAKESLAGRIYSFELAPFSYKEFMELNGALFEFDDWKLHEKEAVRLFHDYIRKGGFPELLQESDEEKISAYIKNTVLDRILLIDLPEEFGLKDVQLLKTIMEIAANTPGFILNYDSLSDDLKRSKQTIMDYIYYLEYALVIKPVSNLRAGFLSTSRKLRKIYFTNTGFYSAYLNWPIEQNVFGKIVENAVLQEMGLKYYYREGKKEIDFISKEGKKILPIEVKYGKVEKEAFMNILDGLGCDSGIMITKDAYDIVKENHKKVLFVPAWLFFLFKERFLKMLA